VAGVPPLTPNKREDLAHVTPIENGKRVSVPSSGREKQLIIGSQILERRHYNLACATRTLVTSVVFVVTAR
jgi:hypothetical protein